MTPGTPSEPPGDCVHPARLLPGRRDARSRFDTAVPHAARVYNVWLGGKDHYAADRHAADEVMRRSPQVVTGALANRHFLARVVQVLASDHGICQFLDMGTGTCASYCVPFKRLCGLGFGGAFAAGLFGLGREGDGPAADRAAAGGSCPVLIQVCTVVRDTPMRSATCRGVSSPSGSRVAEGMWW